METRKGGKLKLLWPHHWVTIHHKIKNVGTRLPVEGLTPFTFRTTFVLHDILSTRC